MKKYILIIVIQLITVRLIGAGPSNEPQMIIDTIYSQSLQEDRLISVYLPPDFNKNKIYPVVFSTDGQLLNRIFKKTLDSLIEKDQVPEIIIIGAFSNEKKVEGKDYEYRNCEYIEGWGEDSVLKKRFDNHLIFFTQEMIKYVEQKYPISKERKDRYFYGFSNGAGFGVSLSVLRPDLISHYLCFSMAGGKYNQLKKGVDNYPYISLFYGNKEHLPLTLQIEEFDKYLTDNGYDHNLTIYEGGHDREIWTRLFLEQLDKIVNN